MAGWIARYEQGLANYRARRFAVALADFEAVLAERGHDRPSELMRERCRQFAATMPDAAWQPIVALRTK